MLSWQLTGAGLLTSAVKMPNYHFI